jgi:hypothetical protein
VVVVTVMMVGCLGVERLGSLSTGSGHAKTKNDQIVSSVLKFSVCHFSHS